VAGIVVEDHLIKVNGQPVLDRAAARTMMFGKVGDVVTLTVTRAGTEFVFQIVRGTWV
jgi:C-terminal processing protease CtpA/Prc